MRPSWSSLVERGRVACDVARRGHVGIAAGTVGIALAAPALTHVPLRRLDTLLELVLARPRAHTDLAHTSAVASTVLDVLRGGRPLLRRGCLTRGLTLYFVLRSHRVPVCLVFGMGRVDQGDGFDGHCWLTLDGEPFLEQRDPRPLFAAMYTLGGRHESRAALHGRSEEQT